MAEFRFPKLSEHAAIVGRNGSGKSMLGAFVLSRSAFDVQPFVIVDYKGEELFQSIDRIRQISLNEIPTHPGLYLLESHPGAVDETENWLLRVWDRGEIGLLFDETYMVPDKVALQGILTQGRSKRIPTICLSQRPVAVSRFVFSEASHIAVFHLQDRRDRKTVGEFTPPGMLDERLPDYHSYWYDVKADSKTSVTPYDKLAPVPRAEEIIDAINARLEPKKRWL